MRGLAGGPSCTCSQQSHLWCAFGSPAAPLGGPRAALGMIVRAEEGGSFSVLQPRNRVDGLIGHCAPLNGRPTSLEFTQVHSYLGACYEWRLDSDIK